MDRIKGVWFATEAKAHSSSKIKVYDDKGELLINPETDRLQFKGEKRAFDIVGIRRISLGNHRLNWKTYLKLSLVLLILARFTSESIVYMATVLIAGNLIGIIFGWYLFKWVIITTHEGVNYYFADGRFNGYSGLFGGTRKLFVKLRHALPVISSEQ